MASHGHGVAVFSTQSYTIGLNERAHKSGFFFLRLLRLLTGYRVINAIIFLIHDRLWHLRWRFVSCRKMCCPHPSSPWETDNQKMLCSLVSLSRLKNFLKSRVQLNTSLCKISPKVNPIISNMVMLDTTTCQTGSFWNFRYVTDRRAWRKTGMRLKCYDVNLLQPTLTFFNNQ